MSNKRSTIICLFHEGCRQCEIVRLLRCPKQTISNVIKRFKKLGNETDSPGRSRKNLVRIQRTSISFEIK